MGLGKSLVLPTRAEISNHGNTECSQDSCVDARS